MLLLYIRSAVCLSLAILVTSLTGCANSPVADRLEKSLASDPELQDNPNPFAAKTISEEEEKKQATKLPSELPVDFPEQLKYPNAELEEVTSTEGPASKVTTRWRSSDPSNVISNFYVNQLRQNGWQILQQPKDEIPAIFTARLNNTQVEISIQPKSSINPQAKESQTNQPQANQPQVNQPQVNQPQVNQPQVNQPQVNQPQTNQTQTNQTQTNTELLIEYTNSPQSTAQNNSEDTQNPLPQPGSPDFIGPVANNTESPQSDTSQSPKDSENNSQSATNPAQDFNDFGKVSPELREQIQDLAALGVLDINFDTNSENNKSTSNSGANNPTANQFEPAKNITRREYARWLLAAYNVMHANNPTKQIRLAATSSKPVFRDVSTTDPDFGAIQGLAEAGIIPSPLSGDSTQVLFQPNAPLTREQLILWKVPLDIRQALPAANLESVKQTWGFQDTAKINSKALRAILADFQNGDRANIRRVFGYTTLFQPKKPVTRAEAAVALWYFGTEGEGVSAQDALNSQRQDS